MPNAILPHAAPAVMSLQHATDEPFLNADLAKQYLAVVSEPKTLKIYKAPHALNSEARKDRIAFLAEQLAFKPPDANAVDAIPRWFSHRGRKCRSRASRKPLIPRQNIFRDFS